jgi:excisionase family DNA binding protein
MANMDEDREPFLTLPQVAELLHISTKTAHAMAREGRLPARRLPGMRKYLFVRSEILELVDKSRVGVSGADVSTDDEVSARE